MGVVVPVMFCGPEALPKLPLRFCEIRVRAAALLVQDSLSHVLGLSLCGPLYLSPVVMCF